jgi:hypothetical protein
MKSTAIEHVTGGRNSAFSQANQSVAEFLESVKGSFNLPDLLKPEAQAKELPGIIIRLRFRLR